MIGLLRQLADIPASKCNRYDVMKYWHPEAGGRVEHTEHLNVTLEQAQEICSRPESSFREGDESNWWYLGYIQHESRTAHLSIHRIFRESRKRG